MRNLFSAVINHRIYKSGPAHKYDPTLQMVGVVMAIAPPTLVIPHIFKQIFQPCPVLMLQVLPEPGPTFNPPCPTYPAIWEEWKEKISSKLHTQSFSAFILILRLQ